MGIPIFAETVIAAGKKHVSIPAAAWLNFNLDTWLRDGETYLVKYDGEEYLVKPVRKNDTNSTFCVGNPTLFSAQEGDEDNGLPFLIRSLSNAMKSIAVSVVVADYDRTIYCELVTEEPEADPISYAEYLANPAYRKFPFKGLIGWILEKAKGGDLNG